MLSNIGKQALSSVWFKVSLANLLCTKIVHSCGTFTLPTNQIEAETLGPKKRRDYRLWKARRNSMSLIDKVTAELANISIKGTLILFSEHNQLELLIAREKSKRRRRYISIHCRHYRRRLNEWWRKARNYRRVSSRDDGNNRSFTVEAVNTMTLTLLGRTRIHTPQSTESWKNGKRYNKIGRKPRLIKRRKCLKKLKVR